MTFEDGSIEYRIEDSKRNEGVDDWIHAKMWCGQTVFTFPKAEAQLEAGKTEETIDRARRPDSGNSLGEGQQPSQAKFALLRIMPLAAPRLRDIQVVRAPLLSKSRTGV